MSDSRSSEVSAFIVEGRLIDFAIKDGYKLKGLRIATVEGEIYVKLDKHLRINFNWFLPTGTPLKIYGQKKLNYKTGEWKFKAQRVTLPESASHDNVWERVSPSSRLPVRFSSANEVKPKPAKAKATILVCQKSDCMKRGGKQVCQALQATISDRGLEDNVIIKGTGCMKSCKAGPNLVMPDKTRYKRIQAQEIPALVDKHFDTQDSNSQQHSVEEVTIANQTVNTTGVSEFVW
ncbi:MAG: (2Fe-2S) ferredoxin domain-containing protein [Calothrix sp. MO_192.B10]|nr:(2Fe-2S) ferredoxin domain-containing protein [Calothrix sp. MO_192.B10]